MAKSIYYNTIDKYQEYIQDLVRRKMDFKVSLTNYSRKVSLEHGTMIFNPKGKPEVNTLSLINRVRKDAKNYMASNEFIKPVNIRWYDLIDDIPSDNEVIYKVDIRSAYWNTAIKMGVVTDETNDFFLDAFDGFNPERMKKARLKALGSLATTKRIVHYENGKMLPDKEEFKTEATKILYMHICKIVDEVMRDCVYTIPGCFFYYWDCIFVKASHKKEVVNYFKKKKYDTKTTETRVVYVPFDTGGQLLSIHDDKMYMLPKEKKHLISDLSL